MTSGNGIECNVPVVMLASPRLLPACNRAYLLSISTIGPGAHFFRLLRITNPVIAFDVCPLIFWVVAAQWAIGKTAECSLRGALKRGDRANRGGHRRVFFDTRIPL